MMMITKQKDLHKPIIRIVGCEFEITSKSSFIWFEMTEIEYKNE